MKRKIFLFLIVNLVFLICSAAADATAATAAYPLLPGLAERAGGAPAAAGAGNQMAPLTLLFNPLGFLQAGPIVELEFRLVPGLFLGAHVRFHGLGLLTHLLSSNDEEFWSPAGGVGIRYFFLGDNAPNAFYVGGVAEVGLDGYYGNVGYSDAYHGYSIYLVAAANAGYRWYFGSFVLEAGVSAGLAPTLTSQYSYDNAPSVMIAGGTPVTFFAMAELSLGFAF